jgi:hypothetical protein
LHHGDLAAGSARPLLARPRTKAATRDLWKGDEEL